MLGSDWEQKKAFLIRSLFHETHLSPIYEDSNESLEYNYPQSDDDDSSRPNSPLPSLIIEKEPNKHDEPEEFYTKLEVKVKRIYRKLFIEGKEVNDDDFKTDIDISDDIANERDYEMYEYNNTATIDVDGMNIDSLSNDFRNPNGNSDLESNKSDVSSGNKGNQSFQNVEDEDNTEECSDINSNDENQMLNNSNDEHQMDNNSNDEHQMDNNSQNNYTPRQISVGLEEVENEVNSSESDEENESIEGLDYVQVTTVALVHVDGVPKVFPTPSQVYEEPESIKSDILLTNTAKVHKHKACVETQVCRTVNEDVITKPLNEHSEPNYMQVLTTEQDYVDEAPEMAATTSQAYEDPEPIRSEILPTNSAKDNTATAVVESPVYSAVNDEFITATLEEQFVPGHSSTPRSQVSDSFNTTIEEMRSCTNNQNESFNSILNEDLSIAYSIPEPTQVRRLSKISEESQENNIISRNSTQTSSSDNSNEIQTNILQDSDCISSQTAKKRKRNQNISVPTMEITSWDDLRGNFFVGTPKLFRLCSCIKHTCN